jgi:hypothetical protein
MVQDVGDQIFAKFTAALRAELESPGSARVSPAAPPSAPAADVATPAAAFATAAAPPAQPPIDVLSMGAGAAARAAGRTMRQPVVWVALAVVVILAFWLLGRARP